MEFKDLNLLHPAKFPTREEFIKRWVDDGYKPPPHYIGMLNHMYLYCPFCKMMRWATLMVRSTNDYKYVCQFCKGDIK